MSESDVGENDHQTIGDAIGTGKVRPLGDRLIVRRVEAERETAGGILLPETARDQHRPSEGVVLAVGPGRELKDGSRRPLDVIDGQRILFSRFSGSEVRQSIFEKSGGAFGGDVLVLREDDVLAVIEL